MSVAEIRQHFIDFFASKQHKVVNSAPIVVKNDPTLMFTNAGMNQFKDLFLGNKEAVDSKVVDTQKCLRVSGKHNDLEEVGRDTYHHTMFEMLGNWSFGDYFKTEAIAWAWELLTEVYKLPKEKIYVTVFEGDASDQLEIDQDAVNEWKKWISEDRIIKANKKDNFWEMGDTGPCGPCSEIHFDLRSDEEIAKIPGKDLVNKDHPQVIEIWNLVFMQYNRKADGKLVPLPNKHVDTGMGLERLAVVIQNKQSNYDTDVFSYLIQYLENKFHIKYRDNPDNDIAIRVIADHIRAITFTIADGQLPSNTGAGYVIRRILRRAVRYAFKYFNANEPFLFEMSKLVATEFKGVFDEAFQQKDFIARVIEEEENSFLRTLATGTKLFEKYIADSSKKVIPGDFAFELYDTYGFPIDLTELMAEEVGFTVKVDDFNKELKAQKERSKKDAVKQQGDWMIVKDENEVKFVGYDSHIAVGSILRYRKVEAKGKTLYQLVLSQTPFYPEGGGQIGDKGYLQSETERIDIFDTKKENDLIVHYTTKLPSDLNATFSAVINTERRKATERNHSVTHLVHAALKQVLGKHVAQKGSFVGPDMMRFDFSHFSKMTDDEINKVEAIVNQKIRQNIPLIEARSIAMQEAIDKGATALFGEKYGDTVRMITFDENFSIELCGGTHVKATGEIGFCKIVSESAVAAGVRRIEVLTGQAAEDYINAELHILKSIKESIKAKDVLKGIEALQAESKALNQRIEDFINERTTAIKNDLLTAFTTIGSYETLVQQVQLDDANQGRNLIFMLKDVKPNLVVVLASEIGGKAFLWVYINEDLAAKSELDARKIIKEIAPHIKGGGGGQVFFANAGGKNPKGIPQALAVAKEKLLAILPTA